MSGLEHTQRYLQWKNFEVPRELLNLEDRFIDPEIIIFGFHM